MLFKCFDIIVSDKSVSGLLAVGVSRKTRRFKWGIEGGRHRSMTKV